MANRMTDSRDFGAAPVIDITPEQLLRRDRALRYERGGSVYGTDGWVGRLRHVVVDESVGEVVALVIQVEETPREILLPIQAVDRTAGSAVYLTGSRQQFMDWATQAPVFERKRAGKADLKNLLQERTRPARDPRRTVLQAGRDYVETAPVASLNPAPRPPLAIVASNSQPDDEPRRSG
jgi:hypothetical protein